VPAPPPGPRPAAPPAGTPAAPPAGTDPSLAHLLGRVAAVEVAVRHAVAVRRGTDPDPDDAFRGLYVSDDHVDRLLSGPATLATTAQAADVRDRAETDADAAEAAGATLRLRHLAAAFGLDPVDVELLVVALAPDLDARFERLYGYLNDDVTRRRATVGLALELAGVSTVSADGRRRVVPGGLLVDAGLLAVEDGERPLLGRTLRVPDRVAAHLLGADDPDPALAGLLADAGPWPDAPPVIPPGLTYLRDRLAGCALAAAAAGVGAVGPPALVLDAERAVEAGELLATARVAAREARLLGTGLVLGPVEALAARGAAAVRVFAEVPCPVVLAGSAPWDPGWALRVPLVLDVDEPDLAARSGLWQRELGSLLADGLDVEAITAPYRMSPPQLTRAAEAARLHAVSDGGAVSAAHLRAGARAQNAAGLERLARRLEPAVGWPDLVLPAMPKALLAELVARVRHRDRVLRDWRLRPGGGRGYGVTALFAGDSGTGKTMSAEVVAGALGLDLYVVNLATVVDKYVGETEKNLERIFTEAAGVNGVLLFDEADAVFGKRSDVKDAHDRYANVETAYLLQRMESFDGVAVLTTNLRANVDEAFTRRLDVVVDFPKPDADHRLELWRRCLPAAVPRDEDLDLRFCADAFELSGGSIRSVAVTAAYLAAAGRHPVRMVDLVTAVHREYRKLGRLAVEAEFGSWFGAWSDDAEVAASGM
jgi:hypothetical protein